ncbi:hypothetical protein [Bacillus cereus]|uniref:hypothetical protein n=1 Tax=Bacillus cereus TaxID=1396 RepID=UPI000BFA55ED|nr:hypothetical protein [Bacillus cereus]PFB24086.1 hypothetical protein CN388_25265 [Bacillus cereus]
MSRHFRLIGLTKLTKHRKGLKERVKRTKDIHLNENTEIVSVREEFEEFGILNPTFKWHRSDELFGNAIEFGGDEYTFGVVIPVKGSWEL